MRASRPTARRPSRQAVAGRDDLGRRPPLRPGPTRTSRSERRRLGQRRRAPRRNAIQPQPGSSPRLASQSVERRPAGSGCDRDVAADVVADRRQRLVQRRLGRGLVDAEADDLVQHRAERRRVGAQHRRRRRARPPRGTGTRTPPVRRGRLALHRRSENTPRGLRGCATSGLGRRRRFAPLAPVALEPEEALGVRRRAVVGLDLVGSEARQSARAAATNVASSMPCATRSPQRCSVSRRRARCASTSSKTPKWVSASRAGPRRSVSAIVRSQASRSMSGGGVGASTKRAGAIRTPTESPAYSVPSSCSIETWWLAWPVLGKHSSPTTSVAHDPDVLLRGRGRARPRARRTCRRRACARSPRACSGRPGEARRRPRRGPGAPGARGRARRRRRRGRSGCGRAGDGGSRRARARARRARLQRREARSSARSRRAPRPSSVSTR